MHFYHQPKFPSESRPLLDQEEDKQGEEGLDNVCRRYHYCPDRVSACCWSLTSSLCLHTHTHRGTYIHADTHAVTYMHTHTHAHAHTRTRTRTHQLLHTHTHACTSVAEDMREILPSMTMTSSWSPSSLTSRVPFRDNVNGFGALPICMLSDNSGCKHTNVRAHSHAHMRRRTHTYAHIQTYTHTMCAGSHAHMRRRTHTYAHTQTYTHNMCRFV